MADDLGYADVGCYGRPDIGTPNIDGIAARGVRFLQGYANSAVCSATRTVLITGRYQYRLPLGLEEPISLRRDEWRAVAGGKQPYAIARRNGAPLAFAGLWEGWRSPNGETLRVFTIMTSAANGLMSALHDRMPVVLMEADWARQTGIRWLCSAWRLTTCCGWPVSRAVNSARNNGAELPDRVDGPHAPAPSKCAGWTEPGLTTPTEWPGFIIGASMGGAACSWRD